MCGVNKFKKNYLRKTSTVMSNIYDKNILILIGNISHFSWKLMTKNKN